MDPVLKYWLLLIVKALIWVVEVVSDLLLGYTWTSGNRQERLKAKSQYESSAQLVDVAWRAKETVFKTSRLQYFLYRHCKYVHPQYVIDHKNISLLAVEKDYALFCVTDPDVNIYDTTKFPFLLMGQYLAAKQLVILPTKSFHQLAHELGDPKVPVTMITMTARCGSTLISQLFNLVPGTRSMSEPWAMCNVHELMCRKEITAEENKQLLRSAVRLHCKISPGENVERIVLKMCTLNAAQFADLATMFPNINFFLNTRHPVPSIKSLESALKLVGGNLYHKLGINWREFKGARFAFPYDKKYDSMLDHLSDYFQNVTNAEEAIIFYTGVLVSYFDHKEIYKGAILYENLIENPEKEVKKIFELIGIPEKHVPTALKALEKDSQNGIFGDRGQNKARQLDQGLLKFCDDYMEKAGVPLRTGMTVEEFKHAFGAQCWCCVNLTTVQSKCWCNVQYFFMLHTAQIK